MDVSVLYVSIYLMYSLRNKEKTSAELSADRHECFILSEDRDTTFGRLYIPIETLNLGIVSAPNDPAETQLPHSTNKLKALIKSS